MPATRRARPLLLAPAALVGGLLLGACGDDATSAPTTTAASTTTSAGTGTTTSSAPSTTSPSSTTVPAPTTTGELPGEPQDIGPVAGAVLGVVGVAHDDVLNVRAAPGTDQAVVATLDPLAADVVAAGRTRSLPASWWYEVRTPTGTGWVNARYVAHLGATRDVTDEVADDLGELPGAETMVELGEAVAATRTSEEPPSRVTRPVVPVVAEQATVTMDVVGLGDDAQHGERLVVVADPTPGGEGFVVVSVSAQALCGRGVTSDGLCV